MYTRRGRLPPQQAAPQQLRRHRNTVTSKRSKNSGLRDVKMRGQTLLELSVLTCLCVGLSQVAGDCSQGPCENGATCLDAFLDPGYVCLCLSNFTGANCSLLSNRTCQYSFSNTSGVITSPNYPEQHDNFEDCLYHIRVPSAVSITLNITYMATERLKDYLGVGQGTNESDWQEYSGELDAPLVLSFQNNHAFLIWRSDFNIVEEGWIVRYHSDGVECEWPTNPCQPGYRCVEGYSSHTCEEGSCILDLAVQPNDTLVVRTPNFPANYDNNQYCRWMVTGPEGAVLLVDTSEFRTELNYDWIKYGQGADVNAEDTVLLQLSGSTAPIAFKTEDNRLWMTFNSDHDKTETGISVRISVDSERDTINECSSNPCLNGATCLNGVDKFACYCLPAFSGPVCETEINPNMCYSNPCPPEAECVSENKHIRCMCPLGFRHPSCSTQEVGLCDSSPCKNFGLCTETADGLSFTCDCADGWEGTFCSLDVDECRSNPCLNSGVCMNEANRFTCVCTPYWTGVICNSLVVNQQCLDQPCRNGATCLASGSTYQCVCQPGYRGLLCSFDINECESNPCMNGGTCVNGINEYICQCPFGAVQGTNCQMTICETSPCQNGGTCFERSPLVFSCSCRVGFVGQYCEVPTSKTCESSFCNYNGVCVITEQQVMFCSCNRGYLGKFCETVRDPCEHHQCQSGSTCFASSLLDYMCLCPEGYEGQFCHREMDECVSSPCLNGGICKDLFNAYSCTCPEGYTGVRCDTMLVIQNGTGALQGGTLEMEWIIIMVCLSLLTLFMMGMLCLCCCWRRKDSVG